MKKPINVLTVIILSVGLFASIYNHIKSSKNNIKTIIKTDTKENLNKKTYRKEDWSKKQKNKLN